MNKTDFERNIQNWIVSFVNSDIHLSLVDIYQKTNISKLSNNVVNNIPDSYLYDFICDFCVVVKTNKGEHRLIIVNRYTKSIGITDIGEMSIYAKLSKPLYAFMISLKGHSSEINNIVTNDNIIKPLLNYDSGRNIILFSLSNKVNRDSVLPLYIRSEFYNKLEQL